MSDRTAAFWERVQKVELTGCWVWRGYIARNRYGTWTAQHGGKAVTVYAHRLAYELVVGAIPEGLVLDHLCLNRTCVNPDHLEPITQEENRLRGHGVKVFADGAAFQRNKTHCPKGHPYSGENLYRRADGSRHCRTCAREQYRAYRDRVRAQAAENPPVPRVLKEFCKAGHAFTPENTRLAPTGLQLCRECERERVRAYRSKPRNPALKAATCKNGHPFDEQNTMISPSGDRSCRTCARERQRVYRARKASKAT